MECRVCPKCNRNVYSADTDATVWECPYTDCEMDNEYPISQQEHALRTLENEVRIKEAMIRVLKSRNKQEAGLQYRQVILKSNDIDWRALNEAIMERWSKQGLIDIKTIAWKGLEGKQRK